MLGCILCVVVGGAGGGGVGFSYDLAPTTTKLCHRIHTFRCVCVRSVSSVEVSVSMQAVGQLVGRCLMAGRSPRLPLAAVVVNRVLGAQPLYPDLNRLDPDLLQRVVRICSLVPCDSAGPMHSFSVWYPLAQNWILSHSISDNAYLTFSEEQDDGTLVDLCSQGRSRAVNDANKFEYVDLLVEHKIVRELDAAMQVRVWCCCIVCVCSMLSSAKTASVVNARLCFGDGDRPL